MTVRVGVPLPPPDKCEHEKSCPHFLLRKRRCNMEHKNLGAIPSPYDVRDFTLRALPPQEFPDEFDLGVVAIKDQEDAPTCMPHTMSEIIEYHNFHQKGKYTRFSTEYIYGNRKNDYTTEGMHLRDALHVAFSRGDVPYDVMPGNHWAAEARANVQPKNLILRGIAYPNRISSYYLITNTDELKYALINHGPVAAGMIWYWDYEMQNNTYIYKSQTKGFEYHAVLIVGWTKDQWIVQNSWGEQWGDKGRFYIPMSYGLNLFFELYGVTDDITCLHTPSFMISKFGKVINFFVRLYRKIMAVFGESDPVQRRPQKG